jgi:hypothetical protein
VLSYTSPPMNQLYYGDDWQIFRGRWHRHPILLLVAALTMTFCNLQAHDIDSSAPAASNSDLAAKLIVEFTKNRWTPEKVLIATGTLTNTNGESVTVTNIITTAFDAQHSEVKNALGAPADYTITDTEIAAGATVTFKVALSDPKKVIRFLRAIPYAEPEPTPEPTPTPELRPTPEPPPTPVPTPTPQADLAKHAGPMPDVDTPWGVSLTVHNAIKAKLNDPDSYEYIAVYRPTATYFHNQYCWVVVVRFRSKNGFGGYVVSKAVVWEVVDTGGQETVLDVGIAKD